MGWGKLIAVRGPHQTGWSCMACGYTPPTCTREAQKPFLSSYAGSSIFCHARCVCVVNL